VQEQYEQNPYPRWVAPESRTKYESIDALMKQERPHAPYRALNKRELDVLIAGCGTGRHSIGVAQQLEHAKLLAIDLSSASLGYAKARTNALGVSNIEYAHADILALGSLGRTFDMIQSVGVLHHLAEPWAGWRVLTSLLRPGGVMFIGLYSERARRDVVAARELIATRGYGSTADDIRRARQDLMTQGDEALRNVALFNDFFTLSECRDLLFHVQEHRMTLPQIKDFLAANGLTLLGFEVDFRTAQKYAARFPADKAMTDLECWDQFEQDHPYTFASMYRFWAQKAA
jgi:SAM-dependent methyltransferase